MHKVLIGLLITSAVAAGIGVERFVLAKSSVAAQSEQSNQTEAQKPLYWVAPMDPNYKRDQPGKSPMGMDLIPIYPEDKSSDPALVTVPAAVVNSLGVRTADVELSEQVDEIVTMAQIKYDANTLSQVNTRTDGWIEVLNFKEEGEPVKKGEVLFELYSPTLVNAQEEFLSVLATGSASLIRAAKARLHSLGGTDRLIQQLERTRKVSRRLSYTADRSGYVTRLPVREGQYVTPMTEVMSISDLTSVWVIADVLEKQSQWLRVGQAAELTLDYLPGERFDGRIDYIYPAVEEKTRTLRARLTFDNSSMRLKPNMFAQVRIQADSGELAVNVPHQAVIRGGRADRVVLALGDGKFKSVPVRLGKAFKDRISIVSGLEPGQQVVVSSQFLIDSESNIDAELARMEADERRDVAKKQISGRGRISRVMAEQGRLELRHDPIDALQWPAMTMSFDVKAGVDLSQIEAGQNVRFSLIENDGDYLIDSLAAEQLPVGQGTVTSVMAGHGMLGINHEPIELLGWPTMTMNFDVAEGVSLEQLKSGDRIRFVLTNIDDSWVIEQVTLIK